MEDVHVEVDVGLFLVLETQWFSLEYSLKYVCMDVVYLKLTIQNVYIKCVLLPKKLKVFKKPPQKNMLLIKVNN